MRTPIPAHQQASGARWPLRVVPLFQPGDDGDPEDRHAVRNTNAIEVFSGVNPWMADSRMLVGYVVPRKANMPGL